MPEKKVQDFINKDVQKDIECLYKHADIANKEMGEVKEKLSIIQADVSWLKEAFWKIAVAIGILIVATLINMIFKI